jgi:hypothetical protein
VKNYPLYTHSEGETGLGTIISFSCVSEDVETVKAFLRERVRNIEVPIIRAVDVEHEAGRRYSRYQIKQHKYAGGQDESGGGYIEVLEIANPPDGRHPFIIHEYNTSSGSCFSEWTDIASAKKVYEKNWCSSRWHDTIVSLAGFKRLVNCGKLTPWFYAVGDEVLHGDYALVAGLEDDPVFRLGKQFVVPMENGVFKVKTCMGSRLIVEHREYDMSGQHTDVWRYVHFDDGTTLRILKDNSVDGDGDDNSFPRPLREGEAWITEAVEQFYSLLSGMKEGFQMKFADGRVFTAKLSHKGKAPPSVAGDYLLKIKITDSEVRGWVRNFVPTTDYPDIISYVRSKSKYSNTSKIEILKCKPTQGGKKWSGVFFVSKSV